METEEMIRQDMEATRESLTEKVETLEKKVGVSAEEGAKAVVGAEEAIRKSVAGVDAALSRIAQHPWLMVGGSLLCGYAIGRASGGTSKIRLPFPPPLAGPTAWQTFAPEIDHCKRLALGLALGMVRETVVQSAPVHIADHVRTILDGVTAKLGGAVIPSSDFPAPPPGAEPSQH